MEGDADKEPQFIEVIRDLRKRDPFVPFRIVMTSGEKYVIENPDSMAIGQTQVFYCFPKSDQVAWLRVNQIASIETVDWKPAA
jgi:hypothetical protein